MWTPWGKQKDKSKFLGEVLGWLPAGSVVAIQLQSKSQHLQDDINTNLCLEIFLQNSFPNNTVERVLFCMWLLCYFNLSALMTRSAFFRFTVSVQRGVHTLSQRRIKPSAVLHSS